MVVKSLIITLNVLLFKDADSDNGMQLTAMSLCVIVEMRIWQINGEPKPPPCHISLKRWDS